MIRCIPAVLARILRAGSILAALALAACVGGRAQLATEDWAPAPPQVPPQAERTSGAIYAAGQDLRLFEDLRAHRVGDILTVELIERTDARKSSSTSTSKSTDLSIGNPTLAGRPVTAGGVPVLEQSLDSSQAFSGEGDSSQSNSLQGSITVTVSHVLPNGNLMIRGEKWLTINQGDEFVRLSGIVRPFDIGPDNAIPSDKIADARITYSGKGTVASANRMGWLARFFNSDWVPF